MNKTKMEMVTVPIYESGVLFAVAPKVADLRYYFNCAHQEYEISDECLNTASEAVPKLGNELKGFAVDCGHGNVIVCVADAEDKGTVAHELFHAAHFVLSYHGVEIGEDGEAYAYVIEWLTRRFYEMLGEEGGE